MPIVTARPTTPASPTPTSQLDPAIRRDDTRSVRGAAVSSPTITTVHRRARIYWATTGTERCHRTPFVVDFRQFIAS